MIERDPTLARAAGGRACPTCGPRPSTRRATRWPARVDDILSRRTRARLLARDASAEAAPAVAALVADDLGWDDGRAASARSSAYRGRDRRSERRRPARPARDRPRRRHRSLSRDRLPHLPASPCPTSDPGAPTAADRPGRRSGRRCTPTWTSRRWPCPTRCWPGCAGRARRSPPTRRSRAEASRDWWPLAMTWALDGQVAGLAAAVARPVVDRRDRRRAAHLQRGRPSR